MVARRKNRLDTLVERLAGEGVEAAAFSADLSEPAEVPALISAVRDRFGRIDVVEYGPIGDDMPFSPAAELDAATLEGLSRLLPLTPVEVFRAVLPEMTARGDGALMMTTVYSAVRPMPHLSGVGPVMAAARNHLHSLHGELADTGVYTGTLSVEAGIARSAMAEARMGGTRTGSALLNAFPIVDQNDLAERYWDMYTTRDRVERIHPEPTVPAPDAG
ncbi:SDR family NAD(P)-dependent oxidoreductase [Nocardiopsis alba]|uniref:SDR family NAD(P)-dependent oxidoreductase n=1 Tax=Nocardiopsis alba TaxID=53437 RepID=UPI0033B20A87